MPFVSNAVGTGLALSECPLHTLSECPPAALSMYLLLALFVCLPAALSVAVGTGLALCVSPLHTLPMFSPPALPVFPPSALSCFFVYTPLQVYVPLQYLKVAETSKPVQFVS